jgi:hypothetical protein
MSKFNVNQNHPLIENGNYYLPEKKFVSIHSEDRDIVKYPDPACFEIELPQDYLNVQSIKLSAWSFPSNYNVFSEGNGNLRMIFKFTNIYNPIENKNNNPLDIAIYNALNFYNDKDEYYLFEIETGFYNPTQMATQLTNKMNECVTKKIILFFETHEKYKYLIDLFIEYLVLL